MMTTTKSGIWRGKSGASYNFEVYRKEDYTENIACVYIYTYLNHEGDVEGAVYVGQTEQLADRIRQHAQDDNPSCRCIQSSGATHICVLREGSEDKRRYIEKDIMDNYKWECNQE